MSNHTKVFGEHDESTLKQFYDVACRAERAALMADGHLGYTMPVGGVAAYDNRVSITGVGVDIACGNAAIRTDLRLEDVEDRLQEIADDVFASLSFGVGLTNQSEDAPDDHGLFEDGRWVLLPPRIRDGLKQKARAQLGTIGGGNHYVDLFSDEDGRIWVGVHFGSRGFGHTVSTGFLGYAIGEDWGTSPKVRPDMPSEGLVSLRNAIGHDYWNLMGLAGRYAYAGREWVARKVVKIIGGEEQELIHNHHNFAWKEEHLGRELIVVRKGATPAAPGQKGFVGGSMGDDAVILEGADPEEGSAEQWTQKQALYSTVHGAGRVMSRTRAKKTIDHDDVKEWIDDVGVIVKGSGLDEAPQAYRRLPEVLEAQGPTVNVLHTLRPLIVCMAPDGTEDPYKD